MLEKKYTKILNRSYYTHIQNVHFDFDKTQCTFIRDSNAYNLCTMNYYYNYNSILRFNILSRHKVFLRFLHDRSVMRFYL